MGNRDINKMRFAHELSPKRVEEGLDAHRGVYWIKNSQPSDLRRTH
jgi:hypothetical protein